MKFAYKALSLCLLLASAIKADGITMTDVLPWAAVMGCGEILHQVSKEAKRTPCDKDNAERMARDMATVFTGGVLMSCIENAMDKQSNDLKSMLKKAAIKTGVSYCAYRVSNSKAMNDMLRRCPGVRGIMCDSDCNCDCREMTPASIVRYAATCYAMDKVVSQFIK
ncbi:hypothetical protein A3F66_00720 [candidate division TM6 bacterium RIFCSPHIGHO2_12_FULL_32_22]|nr:MAG: hypothetical protein A3F66_00720 [candidate division TM6 bacterium RIFCSPHIGHO2_12_FULL_32_22]